MLRSFSRTRVIEPRILQYSTTNLDSNATRNAELLMYRYPRVGADPRQYCTVDGNLCHFWHPTYMANELAEWYHTELPSY